MKTKRKLYHEYVKHYGVPKDEMIHSKKPNPIIQILRKILKKNC